MDEILEAEIKAVLIREAKTMGDAIQALCINEQYTEAVEAYIKLLEAFNNSDVDVKNQDFMQYKGFS